jgi:hypothetical protein
MFYRHLLFWMMALGLMTGTFVSWKHLPFFQKQQPATGHTQVTVYQSTGKAGEVAFSDRPQEGFPRVVDTRQGTTYASTYHGQVPQTASVTYNAPNPHHAALDPVRHLRHENLKTQQHMIEARERQLMEATGQTH